MAGKLSRLVKMALVLLLTMALAAGCSPPQADEPASAPAAERPTEDAHDDAAAHGDELPVLTAAALAEGERLQVVASTNIVADVVSQVGGDRIDLLPLIPLGSDPHSYEPRPQDLVELHDAHVIFINGLGLEGALDSVLAELDADVVSVNAGVATRAGGESHADEEQNAEEAADHAHEHGAVDPHTWLSVHAVEQWVTNIAAALSDLDPANAAVYAANADGYRAELAALEVELAAMVATVPPERRKLVTDHDAFGYLADAYGFDVVGTVIPSLSTLAAPSAAQLAALQDQIAAEAVPAIFVGTTVSPDLAEQLARDAGVVVTALYTGSLSDAEGPASTYLDLMRHNMTVITDALQ